jgi:hypothetical protein
LQAAQDTALEEAPPAQRESIAPGELRQFSIVAGLSDEQLQQFLRFGELCRALPKEQVLKKGDAGDALLFVLDGSVRARLMIGLEDRIKPTRRLKRRADKAGAKELARRD